MTKEALKLALEALENPWKAGPDGVADAIIAIKEALAQPSVSVEQEPVAFVKGCNRGQWEIFPAKAHQIFEREQPLYTAPQRTWVGLTEDEVALIAADCSLVTPSDFYFAQAIEAKLRSKNGY